MATLLELRRRVRSVKNMRQITRAMKLVAGAKLRRSQDSMLAARPYASKMWDVLGELPTDDAGQLDHALLDTSRDGHITAVVITSDRGLCGAFNSNVIRYAHRALGVWGQLDVKVIAVGRKGWDHFRRRGDIEVERADEDLLKNLSYPRAAAAAQYLIDQFVSGNTDTVYLIYNEFVSALSQNLVVEPLLPIRDLPFGTERGLSFREAARAYAEAQTGGQAHEGFGVIGAVAGALGETLEENRSRDHVALVEMIDYIFEPDARAIVDTLLPRFVEAQVYQALLESSAAEHAARMAAMDDATKNAEEMIDDLTLTMNKLRQEAITTEILEVVGGAEALA